MDSAALLSDAFDRVLESATDVVSGLDTDALGFRPDDRGNSIAWLIWHLTRVQDDHVADLAGTEQRWTAGDWFDRFGLDLRPADTGYGHGSDQVSEVVVEGALLIGYLTDVTAASKDYLGTLSDADYDRVVDTAWDPPVTLGTRLVSVVNDDTQHIGQAAYVRGLLGR